MPVSSSEFVKSEEETLAFPPLIKASATYVEKNWNNDGR
jgi:hypothetical protein